MCLILGWIRKKFRRKAESASSLSLVEKANVQQSSRSQKGRYINGKSSEKQEQT
jgi:hypothetical protein